MLSISPRCLTKFLSFVVLGLLGASLVSQFFTAIYGCETGFICSLAKFVNVDREKNLPSLYSTLTLVLCSLLLAMIALQKRAEGDRDRHHWTGLAAIFLFLGMDEALSFHEKIDKLIKGVVNTTGIFHYAWLLPALAGVVIVLGFYRPFWQRLPQQSRRLALAALATFLSGAVGMEMLAGLYVSYAQQWNRLLWAMMTLIEEGLEMAGVLILIYALLSYMANYAQEVRIRVGDRPALALDAAPASPYTNSR